MKISQSISSLVPYKPGRPISDIQREFGLSQVIKLASNENALGPSPRAVDAIGNCLSNLHFYPDPSSYDLLTGLSEYYQVDREWIAVGNGSNEIIDLLIRIYCEPGDRIVTSQAAFIAYKICAQAARVETLEIPLDGQMGFDLPAFEDFFGSKARETDRLVFIANPNNPTGTYTRSDALKSLLESVKDQKNRLVIVDEAYFEFVRAADYQSALSMIQSYPNLAVLRTFSKAFGLAGLRVGALIARPEVIELVNRVRNPFNVSTPAQAGCLAALTDTDFLKDSCELVWQGLDQVQEGLQKMGLEFLPSQGNFVLVDCRTEAMELYQKLMRKGVILRPVGVYGFPNHLRFTIGKTEENRVALETLADLLGK